jgi:hypothetical protein
MRVYPWKENLMAITSDLYRIPHDHRWVVAHTWYEGSETQNGSFRGAISDGVRSLGNKKNPCRDVNVEGRLFAVDTWGS